MKKLKQAFLILIAIGLIIMQSCSKEESVEPPKVEIFYSVVDSQVAFTALIKRVETLTWDFGDGETSTEEDPVHIYSDGGFYTVILSGTNSAGETQSDTAELSVNVDAYTYLTGGPTAENGRTWKISANHSSSDVFALADADFSLADEDLPYLPAGTFSYYLGMEEVYDDEFTFYYDGTYVHDTKDDNAAMSGYVYQYIQYLSTGTWNVVNDGGVDYGLCTALYTPEDDATFTYVESEDFTTTSVYGSGGTITYKGVSTLDFSGTEFIGLQDFEDKVIIQNITNSSMRLIMFMAASTDYIGVNTHALILTFTLVDE